MAINKTYINAGDELIIQGSLIVEGNLIQKQYTQINNFEETRFEGELLTINSDGFDPTGNVTNGALRLRSGNEYFYLTFDPSSPNGGTVFDGPITATSFHLTDGGNITRDPQALRAEFDGNSAGAHQLTEEVTIVFDSVDFTIDSNTFVDAGDVTTITSNLIDQTAINLTEGTYGKVDTVAKFTVNNKGIVTHAEDKYIDIISAQINDFTQRVRGNISVEMTNPTTGDGGIDYDEVNGIIKYTGPVASEIRAHFTGDYGLNYDPVSGSFEVDITETVTISDNQTVTGDKIFTGNIEFNNPSSSTFTINNDALLNGDVEITGDLIVQGTTTTINTTELFVADNMITLNSDILATSNPTEDAGIEINRGASANVSLRWNETNDRWEWSNDETSFYTLDFNDGITYNATTLKWTADDTVVRTERARIQTLEGTYTFSADSSITVNGNFDGSGDIDLRNADLYVPRTPTTTTISGSIYWDESTNKLWILHANGVDYIELTPTYYVGELSSVGSTATNHFEVYAGVWYEEIPGNHIAHHGFKTLTDDNDIITITEPVPSANVISIAGNIYNIYNKFSHTNDTNYGNITYNKNTGVISFAGVTTRNIRDQISAGWGIAYNPVDGIIKTTISTDNGWKFTTDTAGEVDVLHTDLVTIRGTANISVTHVGNVITIDNTDRSDIASVTAGAGLGGGGEVGDVTLYVNTGNVIEIYNDTVTHSAVLRTDTASSQGPDFGDTFLMVDSVTTSLEGHITGLNANAITLPQFYVQENSGTNIKINDEEALNFSNGNIIEAEITNTTGSPIIKFHHNLVARADSTATAEGPDNAGTFNVVSSVTTTPEGHVTGVVTKDITLPTFNIQGNGGTEIQINDDEEINFINGTVTTAVVVNQVNPTVTFNHNAVIRTDTTTSTGPDFGSTIYVVDSVTSSTEGHITGLNANAITLPKFNIQGNTGTAIQINDDENINFIDGTVTTVTVTNQANPTVKFDHNAVTRTDTTTTATPDFTGMFTVVDGITTSNEGHITAVNVKTVTVPRFHIRQGTGTSVTINDNENISFVDGTYTTAAVVSQANPTVTFNHNDTTRTDSTSTETPTGNVAMVSSVTTNSTGHLTAIDVKTVDFDSRYYTETEADGRFVNVTGDTMTGDLTFSDDAEGIVWSRNTDGAYIKFFNTGDGDTNSRLEFATMDNGNEFFRWVHLTPGTTTHELMTLKYNAGVGDLTLTGAFNCDSYDQYVEDEISKSFPAGALGQVPFVSQDGTRLAEMDYTLKIGQYVDTDDDLTAAQTRITTQEDIFLTWYRFSHSGSVNYPANAAELSAWTYNAGTELINNTTNSGTYIGMVSIDRYVDYVHEVRLYSTNSDDDAIGVVIAFHDDGVREHTLSALRSTGGNGFTWQIWYNYSQADAQLIADGNSQIAWGNGAYGATSGAAGYVSNQALGGWDDFGTIGTKVKVTRNGDSILCETTELGSNTYKAAANLSFSLTGLAILDKFRGPKSIGYSTYSQANSFFEIINFSDISNAIVDSRDGTIYLYQSGAWVAQPVATFNVWSEIGIGRLLYDEYTQNMFYVDSETTVTKVVHNRDGEFTLKASSDGSMISLDTRGIDYTPSSRNAGLYADFKENVIDGLNDGGTYHGVLTFRPYGSGTDMTGGTTHQLGFTSNGNLWMRESTDATTWNAWHKLQSSLATSTTIGSIKLGDDTDQTVAANGVTATAGRTYAIQLNADDQAVVNVPWTDTVYTHPTFTGNDLGTALTGATVISDVNVNSEGHVTSFATRDLTASDVGAAASSHTHAYLPLAGGTMNAGAVISWPNDAYGGSGDVANLGVYNPAGEDTVLRLYVNNDVGDKIELNASGGVDVPRGGMRVTGLLTATQKSFTIDHPTKPGMKLRYGSLEGPENGVYVRGKTTSNVIELPDYWTGLVDPESITVQLTAKGSFQQLFVKEIVNNKVYIENAAGSNIDCFYFIQAERVDVDKLIVEFNA